MDADEQRQNFDDLETHLRQRISNLLAKLGSKLFDISRRIDEHADKLDDHEARLRALEKTDATPGATDDLRQRQLVIGRAIMRRMGAYFSAEELIDLMLDFGMDHEGVSGGKEQQIRAIVLRFYRRNTLGLLVMRLRELRPHVEWPSL